ncbi:MAG TPA: methyl-accepting chemotaxis protein, partial [Chthonomonadaceae bacterium]|nr:methyl-accepting chemotaxis protein [Chthonomonadaceae bacterium]
SNVEMTLQTMQTLDTILGEINRVMSRVAVGDLTPRIRTKAAGELQRLAEGINTSLDSLQKTLRLVYDNTLQVTAASTQTSATAGQVAEGVHSQTASVSALAQSIEQTTQAALQVLEHTESARQRSRQSAALVQQGQDRVRQMLDSVRAIAENSNEIGAITAMIADIAAKTQMLSLNANIEAARAGEQGLGFAVVANEVSKLALQVTERAGEIKTFVQQACLSSQAGVKIAQGVSEEMNRIVQNVLETDGMLEGIAVAIEQQTGITQGMQSSVQRLQTIAVADADAAEQMAVAMTDLTRLATQTREQIEQFQVA